MRRFPALATAPRARLGTFPTPVQTVALPDGRALVIKRDDRSAAAIGGNKVRSLEWLLGDVRQGDRIVTVGPRGSTHALTTATFGRTIGADVTVARWNQEMNAAARSVDARIKATARVIDAGWLPAAYAVASLMRLRGAHWIPAGAAAPLAVLGHVNAALELAEQIASGQCEQVDLLVVPFGTGGTAAGLALGLKIAGLATRVVAVRVVPRPLGNVRRLVRLGEAAASLIERITGERVARFDRNDVRIEHAFYGGAYGRPLEVRPAEEAVLESIGVRLDDTYSRKAFAAALAQHDRPTLFWLTFDGRLLD